MTIDAALTPEPIPHLGVIIVSFNSGDVLPSCLESLLAATGVALSIVIVDNASSDDTLGRIEAWAAGEDGGVPPSDSVVPFPKAARPIALDGSPHASGHDVRLIRGPRNLGYAGGVNEGLRALLPLDALDRFWILNPDSVIPDGTARAFAMHPGGFSLLGGRVLYHDNSNAIQIDGGTIRWLTGTTHNVNQFKNAARSPMPTGEDLDFITGASMVASRAFVEQVGMMEESYFLYYEEVDWALRRGAMPACLCARSCRLSSCRDRHRFACTRATRFRVLPLLQEPCPDEVSGQIQAINGRDGIRIFNRQSRAAAPQRVSTRSHSGPYGKFWCSAAV